MSARIPPPEGWVELQLRGLVLDPTSEAPVVILRELDSSLYLPIWIGAFEANAIAMGAENVKAPRPLTHDLLASTIRSLEGSLARVEIHDLIDGTFFARLIVDRGARGPIAIDSRPSDAIALAVRLDSAIWASRAVLDAALGASRALETSDEERIREWLERAGPEDLGKYSM